VNWREYLETVPVLPDTEESAREAYAEQLRRIDTEVDEADREQARGALGDTWGESARFMGWTLTRRKPEA
jgi:hypothetical protein